VYRLVTIPTLPAVLDAVAKLLQLLSEEEEEEEESTYMGYEYPGRVGQRGFVLPVSTATT